MKVYESSEIRNVALIGHGNCGKTTLAAGMLFASGATNRLTRVDEGNTVTDFDEDEIQRMVKDAEANKAEDHKRVELAQARNFEEQARVREENGLYLSERLTEIGGFLPQRSVKAKPLEVPKLEAFSDLLISPELYSILGPAINSGRGMFLYGYPGNGKTSIAERITRSASDSRRSISSQVFSAASATDASLIFGSSDTACCTRSQHFTDSSPRRTSMRSAASTSEMPSPRKCHHPSGLPAAPACRAAPAGSPGC